MSYSLGLKQAYETTKFGTDAVRAREDFEDVLTYVSAEHRPVVVIDDTEHFVHRGADGGVDVESVTNLFHNGIRALAELQKVDVVVAIHPKYRDVPEVQDVGERFGFISVEVPALRAESDTPGLAEILGKRIERYNVNAALGEVMGPEALCQLEGMYFANGHDLRKALDLAAGAAARAWDEGAARVEPRHLQPLLDRAV